MESVNWALLSPPWRITFFVLMAVIVVAPAFTSYAVGERGIWFGVAAQVLSLVGVLLIFKKVGAVRWSLLVLLLAVLSGLAIFGQFRR